jgi:Photosynthesis system II assembly factor YCF48
MDERELRQAFRAAFDRTRPTPGAADRAFAQVAAGETRAYGPGRRLAGAAAVALALLIVATLLVARGALSVRHATVPAAQPIATPSAAASPSPAASDSPLGVAMGSANRPPPSLVAAQSDRVVLAGWSGGGQLELTSDGGSTWTALRVPAGTLFDLQWLDGDTAMVSTDAGLFRFQRSTLGWTRLSSRTDLVRIDFADRSSGFSVTAAGDVIETQDGGRTLAVRDVGLHPVTWLQWVSATRAWAAGPEGVVTTRDGGATWVRQLGFPAAGGQPAQVSRAQVGFRDEANGFAVFDFTAAAASGFVVYHTADGGATWTAEACTCGSASPPGWLRGTAAASLPQAGQHSDLVVSGPSSATLVSNDANAGTASICGTTDSGRSWACGPAPYQGGAPAAVAVRGRAWWLVGRVGPSGLLLATSPDAGVTWTVRRPWTSSP